MELKGGNPINNNSFSTSENEYESYEDDDFSDLEQPTYTVTAASLKEERTRNRRRSSGQLTQAIMYVILIAALFFGGKALYTKVFNSTKDITNMVKLTEGEIKSRLYISFESSPNEVKNIYQFSKNGEVTVNSNKDLAIPYIDGRQVGVLFKTDKYSMYDIKIGDSQSTAERNMTYKYENSFFLLGDDGEKSDAYFYYNTEKNDCIVVIISRQTNKIVAMTYFTDFAKISEELQYDK